MSQTINTKDAMMSRLIRIPEVLELTGMGHRSTLYRYVRDNRFPKPKCIGSTMKAWRLSDVMEWIDSLPEVDMPTGVQFDES